MKLGAAAAVRGAAPAPTRAGGGGDEAEPVAHRSCGRTQASAA